MKDALTAEITRKTGFESIDLVDLEECSPELGYQILAERKIIKGRKQDLNQPKSRFFRAERRPETYETGMEKLSDSENKGGRIW
ncbi:MAG: hypothetical protein ABEJ72_03845 [Candidatus Aenigmatarchaeota archaeon]